MVDYRAWQEQGAIEDKFHESHTLSVFPLNRGFLITLRSHMTERQPPHSSFNHSEVTFFASFEQGTDIAETLLAHIGSQKLNQPDSSGPKDPIS